MKIIKKNNEFKSKMRVTKSTQQIEEISVIAQRLTEALKAKDGVDGIDGRDVELNRIDHVIQWRRKGEDWKDLVDINELKGKNGIDGIDGINGIDGKIGNQGVRGLTGKTGKPGKDGQDGAEVLMRKDKKYIQWKHEGESKWKNLISINELRGPAGEKGNNLLLGGNIVNGTGIVEEIIAGVNVVVDNTDPKKPIVSSIDNVGAVDSVNGQTGIVVLDTDDIVDTVTNRYTNDLDIARLANTSGTNTGDQDLSGYEPLITGGDSNTVWHGNKTFSQVVEADILLTDNTINNVSTLRHGFMSKLPGNTTIFYRGDGTFASPASTTVPNAYIIQAFSGTTFTLIHNFGSYPLVQLLDSTGAVVVPLSIVNNSADELTVTFTSTGTYTIIATLGSPQLQNYTSTAVNYTALVTDKIIEVTAPNVVIELPTANVTNTGFEYSIDNSSNGDITVVGQGGETIQGLAFQTIPSNSSMTTYANGVAWRIT